MTNTSTVLSSDDKAAVTALLARCFKAARSTDHVLMREPERDADGELRGHSWAQTEALDELAEALGIDPLNVSASVVAEELGTA